MLPIEIIETAHNMGSSGTFSGTRKGLHSVSFSWVTWGKGSWSALCFLDWFCFTLPSLQFQMDCLVLVFQKRSLSNQVPMWVSGQHVAASWPSCKHQTMHVCQGWLFFLKISSTEIFIQVPGSRRVCTLKFKEIPERLCQTWISPTREGEERRKDEPQWETSSNE